MQFRSLGSYGYTSDRVRYAPLAHSTWRQTSMAVKVTSASLYEIFVPLFLIVCVSSALFFNAELARTRMPAQAVSGAGYCEAVASSGLAAARLAFDEMSTTS